MTSGSDEARLRQWHPVPGTPVAVGHASQLGNDFAGDVPRQYHDDVMVLGYFIVLV
jgi:hypothetical protein